ncbi:hypothetical protein [Clostridium massiliodielmoense]|uniref:hypothetical protein n=1 Tax=Clostridium massiliodielmoense TaxID=1776385 RepID=UPI00057DB09F|nr:hypothetical protein [Clostridium massiliodielmoense]
MELINGVITIIALMFFIPISVWFIKKVIKTMKSLNIFFVDKLLYMEKFIWNKFKPKVIRRK